MHIFTYGTLMFPEVWTAVTGRMFESVAGELRGFSCFRVVDAVFPGVVETDGGIVVGVTYLDVNDAAVGRLDRFEDDFYSRQHVTIVCPDGQIRIADAYIVLSENRHVLTNEPWTRESFIAGEGLKKFKAQFAGFGRIADEYE